MKDQHRSRLYSTALCWIACVIAPVAAQTPDSPNRFLPQDPMVTGAPYSADQITTVRLTTFGSLIEGQVIARVYRDSAGRIRREQAVGGLETPGSDRSDLVVTIVDPVAGVMYTLNPATRTAYRMPIDRTGSAPSRVQEESLGTREFEGLAAVGRRSVVTLPGGQAGNPAAVEIVDERWDSVDLRVALLARHRDSRSGEFEQRLANVRKAEPDPNLFTVPSTYTITDVTPPAGK